MILNEKFSEISALLYFHFRIFYIFLRYMIKMVKSLAILLKVVFIFNDSSFEEDDKINITTILKDSIKLGLSMSIGSMVLMIGIKYLIYTYVDFNLYNVIPTYVLTMILLLLINIKTDTYYLNYYNLKLKLKKKFWN